MSFETWLLFALTEAAVCLIPGPAVLLVVSIAVSRDQARAMRAGLGVLAANAFYFLLSATGIGAILEASHEAFMVVKWLGAAYLFWLGARMLMARKPVRLPGDDREPHLSQRRAAADHHALIQGFVTQAANPKAMLFFISLLPQFVDPAEPLLPQITILAITSIAIEFGVLSGYATLVNRALVMTNDDRLGATIERLGGTLLVAAAVGLASTSNREA